MACSHFGGWVALIRAREERFARADNWSAREPRTFPGGYAFVVKRLRALRERLSHGHRPPTGPLTTAEATEAEELRKETLAEDAETIEREQRKSEPDSSSG